MRALLLLLLLAPAARAQTIPPLTGRVVDAGDMLSPETEAVITARLATFEDSTSTQIVVLTIPSLDGGDLEPFATEVFRTWGIGQRGRNNGALLLVARDDHELRIEVGYGLEGDLTDARAATIIREIMVPRLREDDPDSAVSAGVDAMVASVTGTFTEPVEEPLPVWLGALLSLIGTALPLAGVAGMLRTGIPGVWGTVVAGIVGAIAGVVLAVVSFAVTTSGGVALALLVLVPVAAMGLDVYLERHPVYGPARRKRRERNRIIRAAQRRGDRSVVIDGVTHSVPVPSSSSSSSSGGFSGGGGSSGGGGASGSW
ncbi:MAG TPA: TPM domain-containing protein [Rubricoccaceae bacterium]|jgi:uncharacterized protein